VNLLREKGIAVAAKRETRATMEGVVASYIHTGGRIGVLVEMDCETSFVAKTDEFQNLARDLAMHIAWGKPEYITREEIPEDVLATEREVHRQWAIKEGKPEQALDKIVTGRMEKFYAQACLMDQAFFRDQDVTVNEVVKEVMGKLGEKIKVGKFVRYCVGQSES